MTNNLKKGFTLVELSIVLVIIGLLIGGILVAQSMIGTAKIQSTVRQLGQFDAAVANFYTKFNQIPGDDNVMGASAGTAKKGDNDGFLSDGAIASPGPTCAAATLFAGEIGKFWYDLSISGLKTTGTAPTYTDQTANAAAIAAGAIVNTSIPQAPVGSNLGYFTCSSAVATNWYVLGYLAAGAAGINVDDDTNGLKGSEAVAIDTKLDDGNRNGGYIQGVQTQGAAGTIALTPASGTTKYTIAASDAKNSTLFIRLGVQTGNLQ